jgi:hypothetical protein
MMTAATDVLHRVHALTLREWCVAAGVMSLVLAIAWIGRNVSRLLDALGSTQERLRALESKQHRLRKLVEKQSKPSQSKPLDWRDGMQLTEQRDSGEIDLTKIEFKKP